MRSVAANLLMDMVEQCGFVTSLFDQKNTHERRIGTWKTSEGRQAAQKLVRELETACTELVEMYREAVKEGIHTNIMDKILAHNLPASLVIDLEVAA